MVFALPFPRTNGTLDTIGFGHFSSQLGTAFRVWPNPEQVVELVLVEAQQQAANYPEALWAPDAHNEKFSLIFQGPASFRLDQDTYLFEHPGLGRFPMFIVPVFTGSSEDAYYEAIFNRPFIQRNRRNLRAR